jgi:hypothetical protein
MTASFTIPKGFTAPDGVKEGSEFSEIAKFKIADGKIHIIAIGQDETPIESKSEKPKPKKAKDAMKEEIAAMESEDAMVEDEAMAEEETAEEEMV